MFANRRLVSAKNPIDHKLLMQIRNGHLNEGFNSRKSSSASTKPISKYNLLHSYFEYNFSGEYSKRIAQELKRQIKSCNKYKQLEPSFIDSVRQKILYVHNYNVKVTKVTFAYPFSNEFVELLIQYILIEFRALYRRQDHIDVREASVRDRILRILMHIFNAFFESKMVPPKEIFEKSAKAIINIFIEIKRDYGVNNKLMENMTTKLLKRAGLFEKIEALKGKNLPCPLDTFLTDHAYSDIYKRTITSDYGTDDGFQMDDDVQIVDDDIVDITASESNEVKEECDDKILTKVSTSSLTKPVLTICLDDSDFESDEETCFFTEEVKTSKKSLEYQTRQRQEDFHKRKHRPMDEVKTEAIKLDISEECNLINTNSKPVNSDVSHSKATLISNINIGVIFGGIQYHNQSNIKNRNMTKSATLVTEIVESSDEEIDIETCDTDSNVINEQIPVELVEKIPEKGPGSQNEECSSKEIAKGLDLSKSGECHEIENIESSNALHDDIESEEISVAVAVGESNTRVVEIDSVEQTTDSCSTKITTIIHPSLYKKNKVSNEVGNMNQSSTSEVSESSIEVTDIPNPILGELNNQAKDLVEKSGICCGGAFKISDETTGTSTTYTDILTTENFTVIGLIADEIKISNREKFCSESVEDNISEVGEQLLENVETSRPLEENNFVVDNQPEPPPNSGICSNSTDNVLFEIETSRESHYDESVNESICNSDSSSSKIVTDGTLGKPFIAGTESNEDNVDLLSLPETLTSNENSGDILSKEKLNTVVNEKVIAKGLEKMGSNILSLRQIAENIIQNNRSEPFKSSVSTFVVTGEGEQVTAEEKPHDMKCPFSLQEPNEVKLSHATLPHQKVLEKNLGNIEDAITGISTNSLQIQQINTCADTLQNNVLDETEIDVKASLPGSFKNSRYQPTEEKISKQNDKEESEDIILNNSENPEKNKQLHEVHEVEYSGTIMDKPRKCCTQLNVESNINGTFPNQNLDHSDELVEDQNPTDIIEEASQSTQPLQDTTLLEESNFDKQLFNKEVEVESDDSKLEFNVKHIFPNVSIDSHDGEQTSFIQENVESINDGTFPNKNSGHSDELAEDQKPTEIIEEAVHIQPLQDTNLMEDSNIDAVEVEVTSDAQLDLDVREKPCTQEHVESNINRTFSNQNIDHSDEVSQITQPLHTTLPEESNSDEQLFNKDVEVGSDDAKSGLNVKHMFPNVSMDSHDGEPSCIQKNVESINDGTFPNKNSGHSDELAEDQKPTEIIEKAVRIQPLQDTTLMEDSNIDAVEVEVTSDAQLDLDVREKPCTQENVESNINRTFSNQNIDHSDEVSQITQPLHTTLPEESNSDEQLFNKDVEVGSDDAKSELNVKHMFPNVSMDSHDGEPSCIQENVESKIDGTFNNKNSDHSDETSQSTQTLHTILPEKRNIDEQLFYKVSEFAVEVEVTSDAQSDLDVMQKPCTQKNIESNSNRTFSNQNLDHSDESSQNTQPLHTTLPEEGNFDEQLFNKNVEVESNDAKSELNVKHMFPNVSIDSHDGEQTSFIQENVELINDGTFPNKNSGHSDELSEDQKPTEIIEEAVRIQPLQDTTLMEDSNIDAVVVEVTSDAQSDLDVMQKPCTQKNIESNGNRTFSNQNLDHSDESSQNTQPLHTTLPEEGIFDEQLFNKDVEVESNDAKSELNVKHMFPNLSIDSHNEQTSCIQENFESKIDGTFPNKNLDIKNEIVEAERQSIQGNFETNFNKEDMKHDMPLSVENAKTSIKECGEQSDHKIKENAKIGENPIALTGVEELFQKPNEPLYEFHNEFAIEVEIGTEVAHSDADMNNIELCNVTDQDKIVQSDQNVLRVQETLLTSIITESQDFFVLHDSGIASNSGSSDSQDNQTQDQADLESEIDLSLRLKRNGVDIFVQEEVSQEAFCPLGVLAESNFDDQRFNKEVKVGSDDAKSELNVKHIFPNVSIDSHDGEQNSCTQENIELNTDEPFPNKNADHSYELAEDQKPTENIEEAVRTQPLPDTTLLEESNINEQPFSVSEFAVEVEVRSDAQSDLDVMQKPCTQENVESNINRTLSNQNLDYSDELAEDQNPTDIIEEASQSTQPFQDTTLLEESNFDKKLFNTEVEVESDDAKSELNIEHIFSNVSIDSHDGEKISCIQENVKSKIDATFPKENSEIENEIVESERQSIQGIFETNFNEEDIKHDIPLSVENAKTSIKECGEQSDHKIKEKAEIAENPIALTGVEELFQKPNEPLFEFHNEFAMEVEIGSEAALSDADINNIEDKIVQSDSFIEDQQITSDTGKLLLGNPDQNVWRAQENLHTSINTESQDFFGQQDSGIASNSGSSDSQDNQSLQVDLESEVDLSLRLKKNVIDIFVQDAVPQEAFCPLDVLAGIAAEAPREIVIEEQKPLRRGRSSKAENDNVNELFEKIKFSQKRQPSNSKVSKYKSKIVTHPIAKKAVRVNDNIRVTRSSHLKNSNENVETSFKLDDFLSVKKSIPPANKIYADRVVDVNVTSEDSNDSESNKLMIDEGASAKPKDIKPKPLHDQSGEYEMDRGINDVSKMSDQQIHVNEVNKENSEDIVKVVKRSIYDEDSLDEELHFCYKPNLEPKISVQQNNEDFNLAEKYLQLPPQDKVVSISTILSTSEENSKTSFESSKPFRTKAERKAYNQPGPNPYISIERLNVSTTENNVPIEKQNRSKSLDIGILKNIGGNSKSPHSKQNLKHPSSIEENTAIKEEIYNNKLTGDNIHVTKLPENSERHRNVNELGDLDETPLAERIKKESQGCLAETSLPEEIAIKSKIKSKRLKTTKKRGATKISKISGKPDVQDTYKSAAEPKNEESDSLVNTNVLQEKKPNDVFHSLPTIDSKKVDDNIQYYTLPKLRRKSISKDKLSRSVSSTTDSVSTSDIKDEDVKCMPPPKMRGKTSASVERFKEQNTELNWKCKNTVSPTTEKLSKKLCKEDPSVKVEMSLSQKPLVDSIEQPQYKFCERNLAISNLSPESEFSNLVNSSLKKESSSDSILLENFAKSTREDSLYENSSKSNDIVYDLSLKPNRKVSDITENEKPVSVTEVEEIPIVTEHKHSATVDATEQEKDERKLDSSSKEKCMVHTSNFVSAPEDVQKDDVSMESKKSLDAESNKPDIDLENPFELDSCPSEDVANILSKPESPKENKGQPLGDCNPEILQVVPKYLNELSSPKKKLETVAIQDSLLTNKSNTSAIIDLNAQAFKNIIGSDGRNEAEEGEKTHTDIVTKLSQSNGDQKIQTSISNTPDLPNESNKTPDLFNEESICNIKSVMKTELKKRKSHVDLSEGSKQNKKRKSRKDLNVVSSTATVDTENSTDKDLIEAVGPGYESEKPLKNEVRKRKTLGIRKMQINHKQNVLPLPLDASKSRPNFESASDDIEDKVANEEIKNEVSQTETSSTPELNVCLDFFSKTSKSKSDLNIKTIQSEESTTEGSINTSKTEEDLLVSLDEHISIKKSCPDSNSTSNSSGGKKNDAVEIAKEELQDVHDTKSAKRKFRPISKSQVHTAKDGQEDIGCNSTQNSSSKSTSKIVSEVNDPHGAKMNEVTQVSEGEPLQKISKRSLSRSCSDGVDEGMDVHYKKFNKISSSNSHGEIEIVRENSNKIEKENSTLETRLSLSTSDSNIQEDILEGDGEKIMKDQNNKSPTIPRLSPHIEDVFETSESLFIQDQNQSIYVQKTDSDKTVTIADTVIFSSQAPQTGYLKNSCGPDNVYNSAVLEITQNDAHSINENQTSADSVNNVMSSNPVCLEETEKIHSSVNTNKSEATCCLKDGLSSTDVPIKNNQEFCLETQERSCGPDNTNNTTPEESLEAKDFTTEDKEISCDLDNSVVNSQMSLHKDKEIICDNYGGEENLNENQKFCGYGCLDNIKQNYLSEVTDMSDIHTLDIILHNEPQIETFTKDYSLIIESESISVSNEIELGHNVVEEKSNNETIDEYEVADSNITVTESNSTIDQSNAELTTDTGNIQLFSSTKYVEADLMSPFLKSESVQDGKTGLSKEEKPVINRDFSKSVQELSGTVVKINVLETSQNTDFPNTCKRKKIITSEPDSEKPADVSNTEKSSIDNLSVVTKSSLSESPRKRERKSIESVVNHLKEKERENSSSFDLTIPVPVESVKSNWVSSIEGGCKKVFADFNSSICLKSDEIPDIHSEVVVSSDQSALISSMSPERYTNRNFVDSSCTVKDENNHPIEQALGKTTENNKQITSRNKDLKPLHVTPDDDVFGLEDSRQSIDIEESCKTLNLSKECSTAKSIKITNVSPTELPANDANVEETIQNLANLRHFGKPTYFKRQSSFVCSSIVNDHGGSDKHDFGQIISVEPTTDHTSSEIRQPGTYNSSLSRNEDISKLDHFTGYAADTSVSTSCNSDSKSDLHLNILGQISENSFITDDSGSPNDITDIIPVPEQADFSQSFKNTYVGNNTDHSYYNYNTYNTADPVMSSAAEEEIFPKVMSDASSELLSNDNPLRDFELSDDFSEFLNTKEVSEGKDSEGKDSESNQNDEYKLKMYNESITQNLLEISRSSQSKEINNLYDLLDGDKMEPNYIAEPSRDHGLWDSIIGSDPTTQKVIVLPNNHCPTSPFHNTHLIENDQSTQRVIEPNNDCLTPTFNMSHTDLYNSFDVSPPGPPCYNMIPREKSESVESLNKRVCISLADFENNSSTLSTSKKDPQKDSPGGLKKPKKTKKSVPKKIVKDLNGVQPNVLPTRSYGRTKPSQWIKSSKSSSPPVEKQDPIVDSSKQVISTDNLLELSFRNSTRILPKKPIVIQGIAATKTTDIASTGIANTSSVSVKEQTRQTILKLDTPKTKAGIPIVQPTSRNLNEKVYSLTNNVNANDAKVSKSSGAGSLPTVAQYKVTPMKHVYKLPLRKLSEEFKLEEVNQNVSSASMKDIECNSVVQNSADIVKSRKRVATKWYSSGSLAETNFKNSSKRRKSPMELNVGVKSTGNVKTKTAVNSTEPVARVVEGDNSRRCQSRASTRSSVESTSESRKSVATNLHSSRSLAEENVKNSSKRRKSPTEPKVIGKPTGNVKTKTAVNSTEPVARVVGGDNSRRSQSRGSSRSSVEPTSESEDPLRKRFKIDEKTPQSAGSKYSVNYSIDRILGKDKNPANERRQSNEGPVKDCRERESRDFTRSSSGTGFKTEPEVVKTNGSIMEDAFDRLLRHKNKTPSYSPRKHSTLRESRYHKPEINAERGFTNERIPRDGSTRVPSAVPHDQRSQERDSRAGNKPYATYQGHSMDHPPYPPEQRKSSGGYYPSAGSSRHSNRQHSGVNSSRSNVSQPTSSTPLQNSRPPRDMTGKDKEEWSSPLVANGYLEEYSSPLFPPPQKSPRDIL